MWQQFRNTPVEKKKKPQMTMTMSSLEHFLPSANRYKAWLYLESTRCLFSCLFSDFLVLWFPENGNSTAQYAEKLWVTLHNSEVE